MFIPTIVVSGVDLPFSITYMRFVVISCPCSACAGSSSSHTTNEMPCSCIPLKDHLFAAQLNPDAPFSLVEGKVLAVVGMLHGRMHKLIWRLRRWIIFLKSAGFVDGESVERFWAKLFGLGPLVKVSSAASYRDLITEAIHATNINKQRSAHTAVTEELRHGIRRVLTTTTEAKAAWKGAVGTLEISATTTLEQGAVHIEQWTREFQQEAIRPPPVVGASVEDVDLSTAFRRSAEVEQCKESLRQYEWLRSLSAAARAALPESEAKRVVPTVAQDAARLGRREKAADTAMGVVMKHPGLMERFSAKDGERLFADDKFCRLLETLTNLITEHELQTYAISHAAPASIQRTSIRRSRSSVRSSIASTVTRLANLQPSCTDSLRNFALPKAESIPDSDAVDVTGVDLMTQFLADVMGAVRATHHAGATAASSKGALRKPRVLAVMAYARWCRARESISILAGEHVEVLKFWNTGMERLVRRLRAIERDITSLTALGREVSWSVKEHLHECVYVNE